MWLSCLTRFFLGSDVPRSFSLPRPYSATRLSTLNTGLSAHHIRGGGKTQGTV